MEVKLADALIHTTYYHSPLGLLLLQAEEEQLTVAGFRDEATVAITEETSSPVLQKTIEIGRAHV